MCTVKTPKVSAADTAPKAPTIIRNLYLDGIGPEQKALRSGRSALRINRAAPGGAPSAPAVTPNPTSPVLPSPPNEGLTGWTPAYDAGSNWGGVGRIKRAPGRIVNV